MMFLFGFFSGLTVATALLLVAIMRAMENEKKEGRR